MKPLQHTTLSKKFQYTYMTTIIEGINLMSYLRSDQAYSYFIFTNRFKSMGNPQECICWREWGIDDALEEDKSIAYNIYNFKTCKIDISISILKATKLYFLFPNALISTTNFDLKQKLIGAFIPITVSKSM